VDRAPTVLDRILSRRIERLGEAMRLRPLREVRAAALDAPEPRDLAGAVSPGRSPAVVRIIAEIKRSSPSRGELRATLDVPAAARGYAAGGADALSVLTEEDHFGGSLADLVAARAASGLPVLRKDFLTDRYQLYEARAAGADAVLLIAAALDRGALRDLAGLAAELGLCALVEAHDAEELDAAAASGAPLVGINNRDLRTLEVSLQTCLRLAPLVAPGRVVVAESGIHGPEDVRLLASSGIRAFLVGEHLMLSSDPVGALRALKGALG
jgi:indole-3-glycerol phosphate synthase